ncbi:MAG: hypothetical protein AB1758_38165, partial [Candidatus Eremiobacterota bacterium]
AGACSGRPVSVVKVVEVDRGSLRVEGGEVLYGSPEQLEGVQVGDRLVISPRTSGMTVLEWNRAAWADPLVAMLR